MIGKLIGSLATVSIGVGLTALGLSRWAPELPLRALPARVLPLLGASAAVVAGQWACFRGLGRLIAPPRASVRAADWLCAVLLGGLAVTAAVTTLHDLTVS